MSHHPSRVPRGAEWWDRRIIPGYNRFGPQAIEGREHGIRRRCYLKKDEEAEFLKPFLDIAPTLVFQGVPYSGACFISLTGALSACTFVRPGSLEEAADNDTPECSN